MEIAEVLVIYVCSIVCFTIYILFVKQSSYRKGFSDGFKQCSDMVEDLLHCINEWDEEMEESGMNLTARIESIKPLNEEKEDKDE